MLEEDLQPTSATTGARTDSGETDELAPLRSLLLGPVRASDELPALSDLVAAAVSLADGTRHRIIIPLAGEPREFALSRRDDRVRIDLYGTESVPQVLFRDREISLKELLSVCERVARRLAEAEPEHDAYQTIRRLAQRAARVRVVSDPHPNLNAVRVSAGAVNDPGDNVPLAFGFDVSIVPSVDVSHDEHLFADVHALLFDGELWAYSRGRRFTLMSGPIMLAAERMVTAVRTLIDAWQAGRTTNVRLLSGNFSVGARLSDDAGVALILGRDGDDLLTLPALSPPDAALPILRLASDLVRAFISADRTQARNLRVTSLRAEVRALRRLVRTRDRLDGFVNDDPDRLRLSLPHESSPSDHENPFVEAQPGRLRFTERWSAEIDGLDSGSTFLCGDRLVLATARVTLALCRDRGEVIWSRPALRANTFMTGRVLLRLLPNGDLELCELEEGAVFARSRVTPRSGGPPFALFGGGSGLPPVAILAEGRRRLVAVDLRTGEPRWRFRSRGQGSLQVRRAGRLLLVVCGHGSVDALEIASGEVVWRYSDRERFDLAPAICGDNVIAASGETGGGSGFLHGIDLYTGRLTWRSEIESPAIAAPVAAGAAAVVPYGRPRRPTLAGFDPGEGRLLWTGEDPGIAAGGSALCLDHALLVNAPSGRIGSVDLDTGEETWHRHLSNPLTDDVPRQLEPVLRHGALFAPAARVHLLRPSDGTATTSIDICDLVPDFLRVDERGCFYVAEESGHLRAYSPMPQLTVVR